MSRPDRRGAWPLMAALGLGLAWSLVLVTPHLRGEASLLDRIEAPLADLRFLLAGPRPAPGDIVVVAIDDATIQAAGGYPLPRPFVARLLRALIRAEVKAIGVDVLFVDPGPPAADSDLAAALAESRAVIGMAALFSRSGDERRASSGALTDLPVAERLIQPNEPSRRAASSTSRRTTAASPGTSPSSSPRTVCSTRRCRCGWRASPAEAPRNSRPTASASAR